MRGIGLPAFTHQVLACALPGLASGTCDAGKVDLGAFHASFLKIRLIVPRLTVALHRSLHRRKS
jgi:hypothetical protein